MLRLYCPGPLRPEMLSRPARDKARLWTSASPTKDTEWHDADNLNISTLFSPQLLVPPHAFFFGLFSVFSCFSRFGSFTCRVTALLKRICHQHRDEHELKLFRPKFQLLKRRWIYFDESPRHRRRVLLKPVTKRRPSTPVI